MKNTYTALFAVIFSLAGIAGAHAATNGSYCPGQTFDPYSYLCTATSTYPKGQPIAFTLRQSRIPLFIGPQQHPWQIVDSSGKVIYTPPSVSPTTQPDPAFSWSDTWNQTNNKGKQVKKGTYSIIFAGMPYNIAPLTITITKKVKPVKGNGLK